MKYFIFLVSLLFTTVLLQAQNIDVKNDADQTKIQLIPNGSANGGQMHLYGPDGTLTMVVGGNHSTNQGSYINFYRGDGQHAIQLDAHHYGGGKFFMRNDAGHVGVDLKTHGTEGNGSIMTLSDAGGVARIHLDTDSGLFGTTLMNLFLPDGTNTLSLNTSTFTGSELHMRDLSGTEKITLLANPGTGGYAVKVDGKMICEEVRIEMSQNWPDYVFDDNYGLLSIPELKHQIQLLGHLPGIPSADQVQREGIEIGDMQRRLLEKVEELTLYMIQAHQEIAELKTANDHLQAQIESMKR